MCPHSTCSRRPRAGICCWCFSLSLLAGFGVDLWAPPEGRSLYWTRLGTAGAGIIGGAAFLGGMLLGDVDQSFIRAFAVAGLWMLASGILSLSKWEAPAQVWKVAAGMLVLLDLVYAGERVEPGDSLRCISWKDAVIRTGFGWASTVYGCGA